MVRVERLEKKYEKRNNASPPQERQTVKSCEKANGESQTAPQNMDDSQPLHLPYTTAGKHHRSEKLVVFMHNTDIALRKRWQKTIST